MSAGLDAEAVSALEDLDVWSAISTCQPENALNTANVKSFEFVHV